MASESALRGILNEIGLVVALEQLSRAVLPTKMPNPACGYHPSPHLMCRVCGCVVFSDILDA